MATYSASPNDDLFFERVIQRYVKNDPLFVERDWLTKRIERELENPSCRFVLITGEPGIGKTALMARLAHQHPDRLRYFLRLDSQTPFRSGSVSSFLLDIGMQLARLHQEIFRPERLEVVVQQRIQDILAGGTATGIKIKEFTVSPFYQAALTVEQDIGKVAGDLIGMDIVRMVTNKRLLKPSNLQFLALFDPAQVLLEEGSTSDAITKVM